MDRVIREHNMEISEELQECIKGLAVAEGLSVEEYLKKAIRTVRFFQKEWNPEDPAPNEEQTPPAEEAPPPPEEGKTTWIEVNGERLEGKSIRAVYRLFIQKVGCRRIYDSYPEEERLLIFNSKPMNRRAELGEIMVDGRYSFWVYTCISKQVYLRFVKTVAEALDLQVSLP